MYTEHKDYIKKLFEFSREHAMIIQKKHKGAAQSISNLKYSAPENSYNYNGSNYDYHFIIRVSKRN